MKKVLLLLALMLPTAEARSVLVSAYNAQSGQTDSSPTITATGSRVRPGIVALSPDLRREFPYHSRVQITCDGFKSIYTVEDSTSARYVNRVDIFMWSHRDAISWGVKRCQIQKA